MSGVKIGIGFGLWRLGMPNPTTICDYAERAEAVGIDSIWLSDHIVSRIPDLDITCVMAVFAARTKRIKMGPSVLTLPARNPVQVAQTYATLDYLSGGCGRVIMGVGLGSDPADSAACGVPAGERAARLEEGVEVLRKLWAGPNVTHAGRFYRFQNVTLEPRPPRGAIDIWIGGRSDQALRRAARFGDGWFPSFVTPGEFAAGLRRLGEYAGLFGRRINPREAGVVLLTRVERERARATDVCRKFLADFPGPLESLLERCAVGEPQECVAKIQSYVEAGCSKYVLWPVAAPDEMVSQVEVYGR